jgi:fructose-1,6-bisphosphatase
VQSTLDIISRDILSDALHANRFVGSFFNEEHEEVVASEASDEVFVAFDPYDGGSVGDANITIGSIFGIWSKPPQMGKPVGEYLLSSAYGLYGPRCLFVCAVASAVYWYEYDGVEFQLGGALSVAKTNGSGIFGPGNIALIRESEQYRALFEQFLERGMVLRYAGSFVADIHHLLVKTGVYFYPRSTKKPHGHLRLLYEVAPLGMLVEVAGGIAVTHDGTRVLDAVLTEYHQRSPIFAATPKYFDLASYFKSFS